MDQSAGLPQRPLVRWDRRQRRPSPPLQRHCKTKRMSAGPSPKPWARWVLRRNQRFPPHRFTNRRQSGGSAGRRRSAGENWESEEVGAGLSSGKSRHGFRRHRPSARWVAGGESVRPTVRSPRRSEASARGGNRGGPCRSVAAAEVGAVVRAVGVDPGHQPDQLLAATASRRSARAEDRRSAGWRASPALRGGSGSTLVIWASGCGP